jgi:hypothetical protein
MESKYPRLRNCRALEQLHPGTYCLIRLTVRGKVPVRLFRMEWMRNHVPHAKQFLAHPLRGPGP